MTCTKDRGRKSFGREFIAYIISGVLVTLSNWLLYSSLMSVWPASLWRLANALSIFLSILLAYILNRKFVFFSNEPVLPELFYFFASRVLVSLIFEHGTMELLIGVFKFNPRVKIFFLEFQLVKLVGSVFVVLGNYFVGKFLIFTSGKKREKQQTFDAKNKLPREQRETY